MKFPRLKKLGKGIFSNKNQMWNEHNEIPEKVDLEHSMLSPEELKELTELFHEGEEHGGEEDRNKSE